jgi:5-(carboxyamino)imidazole ribonucleotide mutase
MMGSHSDREVMSGCTGVLDRFHVGYEERVLSAHRTPEETRDFVIGLEDRGIEVVIAAAGFAAHLAGVVAAHTVLPVIGVPLDSSPMKGIDSLYSTVQMPGGVPVATMAIGKAGAKNAALFAVQILSRKDPKLVEKLKSYRQEMKAKVLEG